MSQRPSIILIHGHGVDVSIWDDIYTELASEFTVIKPDFSKATNHETIEAYAEHLYHLVQAAQVESCLLIGHSMGGYIALAFAERHPELLRGLGLFHSSALADDEAKKEQRQRAIKSLESNGSSVFIEATLPKMIGQRFHDQQKKEVRQLIQTFSRLPAEALIAGLKAMAVRPDRTHILVNATYPILIIAGKQDQIIPFEKSQVQFTLPRKPTIATLEDVGHLGMLEDPIKSIQAIRNFVNALSDD